jgi:hypothetical protein
MRIGHLNAKNTFLVFFVATGVEPDRMWVYAV